MNYLVGLYQRLPDHLNVRVEHADKQVLVQRLEVEADELLSFVGNKKNKQWLWLAMDVRTKQVLTFYMGDRSKRSARKLWKAIPEIYKQTAVFYTDQYKSYPDVIPVSQHRAVFKQFRKTNHIERLNCVSDRGTPGWTVQWLLIYRLSGGGRQRHWIERLSPTRLE